MTKRYITLTAALIALIVGNLLLGAVSIPAGEVLRAIMGADTVRESWTFIVWEYRVPQTVTAMLCGASLAVSGLMLQTAFRNPLADPSILGVSSGAGLGAALVMLAAGGVISTALTGFMAVVAGAFAGAAAVLGIVLFLSTVIRSGVMLLIAGIMIGYVASSAISLLNFFSTDEGVRTFVTWGMGSFSNVSLRQLPWFAAVCILGLLIAITLIKPLNALLLGANYAESLGINVRRTRNMLLITTGLLTAVTTSFCGPIAFIGLAVPHVARLLLGTANHRQLLPVTLIAGAAVALLCNLICILPGSHGIIPLNAVTPLLGAPVVVYVILRIRAK